VAHLQLPDRLCKGPRDVPRAVVGHDPADADAHLAKPGHSAFEEGSGGVTPFVVENFNVGQTTRVVDAHMGELPSDAARPVDASVVARDPVAYPSDPAQLFDVQVAGPRGLAIGIDWLVAVVRGNAVERVRSAQELSPPSGASAVAVVRSALPLGAIAGARRPGPRDRPAAE